MLPTRLLCLSPLLAALVAALPMRASDSPGSLPSLGADTKPTDPLDRAYGLRGDLEKGLAVVAANIAKLEAERFHYRDYNSLKLLGLRLEALAEAREELKQELRETNDRIADLEKRGSGAAGAAPRTEHKEVAPAAGDPFFTVTRASVPGTILRRDLVTDQRLGRSIPTSLASGTADAVYFTNATLKEFGQLAPSSELSVGRHMIEKEFSHFTGLCGLGRHGYFSLRAPDGTLRIAQVPPGREMPVVFNTPVKETPVAMLAAENALVLVTPNQVNRFTRWATENTATVLITDRKDGDPLRPGVQFVTAGEPTQLLFMDPDRKSWGRISEPLNTNKPTFTIERVALPENGIPTGIAAAWAGPVEVLYVTEAARDRIHRVRVADLKAESFQLKEGTRPSAIVPGPEGSVVFTTAGGFGCVTPAGDFRQVPLRHKAPVQPCLLAPGRPGSGKVFFSERLKPGIGSLNLARPAASAGALDCAEAFNGPSLLEGRVEGKTLAQKDRAKAKKKRQAQKAKAQAGGTAPAEPAAAEVETPAETPGEAKTEAVAEARTETKVPAGDDSGEEAEEAGGAKGILTSRHIDRGAFQHVLDRHGHRPEPVRDQDGLAKSQFSADLTGTALGRFNTFKNFVLKVFKDGIYRDGQRPDRATLVLDLAMADPVGRVPSGDGWLATRLVRVVVGTQADGTTFCLKSIYPVPETRGDSKDGKTGGAL